ncbi:MAG: hypothetical protein JSS77_06110 [Acidobacteria bacterium]|nr:hypothetical protein [Acidobacteriota bacterium]
MKTRWRFGVIAGLFLALFSLYPQLNLVYLRGAEYNGHYAYNDIDEVAYASYVHALMDGRPRKNDPYTGRDDSADHPQPESLFSIQFAAPYTIAIPARVLGIGTPWAFTIAGAIAAFLAAFLVFWVARMVLENDWFAMAASLVTLVGGAVFAGEGAMSEVFFDGFSYPYFPGFRRYIPALAFPAFFLFVGAIYKLASDDETNKKANWATVGVAVAAFAYCTFSYFYVWTTAVAWAGCFGVALIAVRLEVFKKCWLRLTAAAVGCGLALIPYAVLLSRRSTTMDDVQLLSSTHALDLTRPPEYVAAMVIIVLILGSIVKILNFRDAKTILVLSLAVSVFVVFNQQVLTGRSLQPIHYQVFIGNYVAGLAFILTIGMLFRSDHAKLSKLMTAAAAALSLIAVFWGFVECFYTVRVLDDVNVLRDKAYPVGRRLTELAAGDTDARSKVILPFDIAVGDDLPTIAPQAVLWARHQHVFAGVSWQENKERYYQYLYYTGVDPEDLLASMKSGRDFVSVIALFGWGRHTDRLSADYKPLTYAELDHEADLYAEYLRRFDPRTARNRPADFALTRADEEPDWTNVDRWYTRDEGEQIGDFVLYKLTLRQ